MFWFGECCAVPAQVGLVMTRHSPLFCCVCVARVPGLCPGILFMSFWYLWLPGCLACAKTPEVYVCLRAEAAQPATRVCANDAQSAEATLVYVLCRGPTRAGHPSPCFASFEGVAPAVLPILYSTIGGSPRSRVQANPGLLTQ